MIVPVATASAMIGPVTIDRATIGRVKIAKTVRARTASVMTGLVMIGRVKIGSPAKIVVHVKIVHATTAGLIAHANAT